ncbi:MAG TPA: CvpA family protein [Planctomycetota bacterium]|nr:CvpA family protein [Planctomycetota bacterium]
MSLSVASLVSVVIFVIIAYSSYRNGLYSTLVMLFVIVLGSMIAVSVLVPLWNTALLGRMGWNAPPVIFLSVFLISVGVLQTVANYLYPPRLVLPKAVDVGGGTVLGLVNAYFLTGVLMTGFSMFPGTGERHNKVVFLGADVFFARTIAWVSRHAGSAPFDADTFLAETKKEKYQYSLNPKIKEREQERLEGECGIRLHKLNQLLREYVDQTGQYPRVVEDLLTVATGKMTPKRAREMITCPATDWRYRIFPGAASPYTFTVADFKAIDGRSEFILIYDAIGGEAGHQGNNKGRRAVLRANGRTDWPSEEEFLEQLQAQYNRLQEQKAPSE